MSVLVAVLGVGLAPATAAAPSGLGRPDAVPTARVGAASRSALPPVNGSLDYLDAGLPSETDPTSPGLFVEDFDEGAITVGNGEPDAQWVHDDVRLRAMAIEGLRGNGQIAVLLAADLYMIFRPDADEIRAKAAALLPRGVAKRVEVLVTSTHNHHGPDTAFDVNHEWYDHMTDMAAEAVAEAVMSREPATIRAGTGDHWFGMVNGRDPEIIDPTMNVLQPPPPTARSSPPPCNGTTIPRRRWAGPRRARRRPRAATSPPTTPVCSPARSRSRPVARPSTSSAPSVGYHPARGERLGGHRRRRSREPVRPAGGRRPGRRGRIDD